MNKKLLLKSSSPILVSACLIGINCKYNAKNNQNDKVINLINIGKKIVPICPEQLGGLTTPREPQHIFNGSGEDVLIGKTKVKNAKNQDVTSNFLKGSNEVL